MESTNLETHRTHKLSLKQLLITAALSFPLLIILINASWSNINVVSGTIITVMVVSIVVALWRTTKGVMAAIKKGADTEFIER